MGLEADVSKVYADYYDGPCELRKPLTDMLIEYLEPKYFMIKYEKDFPVGDILDYMVNKSHGFCKPFYKNKIIFFEKDADRTMFLLTYGQ